MTGADGSGDRARLEALERENRELRRGNEFLLTILALDACAAPPAPARPGSGVNGSAFPSTGPGALADEGARWEAALESEASWETVLVPRGISRW